MEIIPPPYPAHPIKADTSGRVDQDRKDHPIQRDSPDHNNRPVRRDSPTNKDSLNQAHSLDQKDQRTIKTQRYQYQKELKIYEPSNLYEPVPNMEILPPPLPAQAPVRPTYKDSQIQTQLNRNQKPSRNQETIMEPSNLYDPIPHLELIPPPLPPVVPKEPKWRSNVQTQTLDFFPPLS
ncbi:uncharacterized protein LOC126378925 isoform X2 [Pectinophora gossypiella]|nr:uncharacterized protein LOC126378925 isoform X2 [Pectinophora gossypiella]